MTWSLHRRKRFILAVLLALSSAAGLARGADTTWEYRGFAYFLAFRDYDAARVEADLAEIARLGCNWVSLDVALAQDDATSSDLYLPYARAGQSHATLPYRHRPRLWHHFPTDTEIAHFIDAAHDAGLSVMFKPHVHPVHSGMELNNKVGRHRDPMLPSAVHPTDARTWFDVYGRILRHYVREFSFDAVCVGNELSGVYGDSKLWRKLVLSLREERAVPMTCAFNWWVVLHHQNRQLVWLLKLLHLEGATLRALLRYTGHAVVFEPGADRRIAVDAFAEYPDWCDALDSVGINFYFPLSDRREPSLRVLQDAWQQYRIPIPLLSLRVSYVGGLRDWAASVGRPLLFTEGGWGRWDYAARYPADWVVNKSARNDSLQARCYEAFFREAADLGIGMFFWDWAEGGFSPENGPAADVVGRYFGGRP